MFTHHFLRNTQSGYIYNLLGVSDTHLSIYTMFRIYLFWQKPSLPIPVAVRSKSAWLLGSRVPTLLKACMFVSYICCVVYVGATATGWSLVQRNPTVRMCARACVCVRVCVCLVGSDLWTSKWGGLGQNHKKNNIFFTAPPPHRCLPQTLLNGQIHVQH